MSEPTIADEPQYLIFLEDVRGRIQHTQIRVVKSANRELIELYWSLGQLITEKQEALGWGKSVVEQLEDKDQLIVSLQKQVLEQPVVSKKKRAKRKP
jgi:hypothetical protein